MLSYSNLTACAFPWQANEFMDYSLLVGIVKSSVDAGGMSSLPSVASDMDSYDNLSDDDAEWSATDRVRSFSKVGASGSASLLPGFLDGSDSDDSEERGMRSESSDKAVPALSRTGFLSTDADGNVIGDEVSRFYACSPWRGFSMCGSCHMLLVTCELIIAWVGLRVCFCPLVLSRSHDCVPIRLCASTAAVNCA